MYSLQGYLRFPRIGPAHWSAFPGFRMLSGSMACFMALIVESSVALSFWKLGALAIPTPCSPVTVPPSSMQTSKISSTAFDASVPLVFVRGIDYHLRVEVAVRCVAVGSNGDVVSLGYLLESFDGFGNLGNRDSHIISQRYG